ncbi:hypothetical protein K435DRAFT_578991, partial [Dendrothele bispora CBS 962.96]
NIFKQFNLNNSSSIDGDQLGRGGALFRFGFQLSPQLLNLLQEKYGTATDGQYQTAPTISFDRFIRACVAFKRWSKAFRLNGDRNGWNYDDFMYHALTV